MNEVDRVPFILSSVLCESIESIEMNGKKVNERKKNEEQEN